MKNLNELARKIHESNKLRGFDAAQDNIGQSLMLIVGEISEAMDAHQCGRFADMKEYDAEIKYLAENFPTANIEGGFLLNPFEKYIKNTFEDELADIVMRTLDFCAAFGVDIDEAYSETCSSVRDNVGEALFNATSAITSYYNFAKRYDKMTSVHIARPIHIVKTLAIRHDIDIKKHIELKMRYNETRPYKHGKRY